MATAEVTRVLGFKSLSLHACFVDVFEVCTDVPFFVVPHVDCKICPFRGRGAEDVGNELVPENTLPI